MGATRIISRHRMHFIMIPCRRTFATTTWNDLCLILLWLGQCCSNTTTETMTFHHVNVKFLSRLMLSEIQRQCGRKPLPSNLETYYGIVVNPCTMANASLTVRPHLNMTCSIVTIKYLEQFKHNVFF